MTLPTDKEEELQERVESIFREEALEYYISRGQHEGDLLRISPEWMGLAYWLLLTVFVAGLLYTVVGTMNEYATGPAIVRFEGRIDLRSISAGTVTSIEVQPGQRVSANKLLVRFYDAQEVAELERINKEFELQLIKSLNNPSDPAIQQALVLLRSQKELAEARLKERYIRAPQDALVSDIRIRPGQHVSAGEILLSLIGQDQKLTVISILPGHYRPLLKPGMPLRLEPAGYRYAYQQITIESVGDEVVGPNEVRRYLGQEIADAVTITGPVVLVRSRLPSSTFVADGKLYNYHDRMPALAEASVKSERILFALVPGLKAIFEY
jgi:biotin carboxyl carrier protein